MMQFASTRDTQHRVGFSEALGRGLAAGGGLYVPLEWPAAAVASVQAGEPLARQAAQFLAPFAAGDALAAELPAITAEAFNFPAPLVPLEGDRLGVLELFHGPTAAFKDFGARFLAAALVRLRRGAATPLKILVATSGDTGGAVAAAFHGRSGIEVAVLFPKGLVSPTQQQQLTCWGGNILSLAVRGSFDDCQRLVKQAFLDSACSARWDLSSANSINLGRLLPQAVYYVATSLAVRARTGDAASFVIPSGNLGNATACVWARRLGAPIAEIVLAHNANRTVPDFLAEGVLRTRASVPTLASAMDVGSPSNLERLLDLYPDAASLGLALSAVSIDDDAIRARIRADHDRYGALWCPHTATAAEAWARLAPARRAAGRWVLVATAHPAKFREIVEPLVGRPVPMPESLERLFRRQAQFTEIDATLDALRAALESQGP
jgi:threonine synthase